jgi:hypothetical protein
MKHLSETPSVKGQDFSFVKNCPLTVKELERVVARAVPRCWQIGQRPCRYDV